MVKKFFAELVATMILVLVGCGAAMALGCADSAGVVGVAAAFGLSILMLAYTVGPISGGHANPAVSFAKALNKEITWKEFAIYCCAQVCGAAVGCVLLGLVMWAFNSGNFGQNGLMMSAAMSARGVTDPTDGGVLGMAVMLSTMAEIGLTFLFIFLVLGVTNKKEWSNVAGIIIGLALFGVHLVGIRLTGVSVNPARGLMPLIFSMFNGLDVSYKALSLIPAVVGPFLGAFIAASAYKGFFGKKNSEANA